MAENSVESPYMTVEEVRVYFRLESPDTVRRWHATGKLQGGFKSARNKLLFPRDEVELLALEMRAGKYAGDKKEANSESETR